MTKENRVQEAIAIVIEQQDSMVQAAREFCSEIEKLVGDLGYLQSEIENGIYWLENGRPFHVRSDSEQLEHMLHAVMGRLLDVADMRTHLHEFYVAEIIAGFVLGQCEPAEIVRSS